MYVLVKDKKKWTSEDILDLFGYPLNINKSLITIINQELINKVIRMKYTPSFDRLIRKIIDFLEEDGNPEGATVMLGELERERTIFLHKYEKFLSKEEKELFMRKLRLLSIELKQLTYQNIISSSIGSRRR